MNTQIKVLFLCTGNACRSQMAEALLRHVGGQRFCAYSAGSHPAGFVHPLAIKAMRKLGLSIEQARSKSWHEFAGQPMDIIITLCDNAAAETCPVGMEAPVRAHWPHQDPVMLTASEEDRVTMADRVAAMIGDKIRRLVELDTEHLSSEEMTEHLVRIGKS